MGNGDQCAVIGCGNTRRKPHMLVQKAHVGILRWHRARTEEQMKEWEVALNKGPEFKVTKNTMVCSNHFAAGYCSDVCKTPSLYLNGYQCDVTDKPPKLGHVGIVRRKKKEETFFQKEDLIKLKQRSDPKANGTVCNQKITLLNSNWELSDIKNEVLKSPQSTNKSIVVKKNENILKTSTSSGRKILPGLNLKRKPAIKVDHSRTSLHTKSNTPVELFHDILGNSSSKSAEIFFEKSPQNCETEYLPQVKKQKLLQKSLLNTKIHSKSPKVINPNTTNKKPENVNTNCVNQTSEDENTSSSSETNENSDSNPMSNILERPLNQTSENIDSNQLFLTAYIPIKTLESVKQFLPIVDHDYMNSKKRCSSCTELNEKVTKLQQELNQRDNEIVELKQRLEYLKAMGQLSTFKK